MFRQKIVGYVSEVDRMFETFDKTHAKSDSQLAEMKKYERIYQLRDHENVNQDDPELI